PPGGGPPRARTTAVSAPSNGSASGPLAIRRARSRPASSSNTISFETRTLKPGLWIDVVLTDQCTYASPGFVLALYHSVCPKVLERRDRPYGGRAWPRGWD